MAGAGDAVVPQMASSADTVAEQAPDDLAVQVPLHPRPCSMRSASPSSASDGYEADDVIGTLASTASMPVDVVTGDRDLFQVVDDERQVRVLYIARGVGKHERVDNAWVQAKYGIPADRVRRLRRAARRCVRRASRGGRHRREDRRVACSTRYGELDDILAAASNSRTQDQRLGPGQARRRRSTTWPSRPTVVAVARDLDLGVEPDDLRHAGAAA